MWKFVALIALFMVGIFTIVTNIAAEQSGRPGVNPLDSIFGGPRTRISASDPVETLIQRIETAAPAMLKRLTNDREIYAPRNVAGEDLSGHELPAASFNAATAVSTNFSNALLDGATFEGADAGKARFRQARLAGAVLDAGWFADADFAGAILRGGRGRAATFTGAAFEDADISFVSFSGASAARARFTKSYAAGALMIDANLQKADFSGATLTGVRFLRADLSGAKFDGARIDKAQFDGANLHGADLSNALDAEPGQFAKACADADTKLPKGEVANRC